MHHEPVWVSRSAAVDGLEVEVLTQPAINLALVHDRMPLVQTALVRNTREHPQVDAAVTVSLHRRGVGLVRASQTRLGRCRDLGLTGSWLQRCRARA